LIHEDMNTENRVLLQLIPRECNMKMGLEYDNIIGYTKVVSVSISYRKCSDLALSLLSPHVLCLGYFMDSILFPHVLLVYIV